MKDTQTKKDSTFPNEGRKSHLERTIGNNDLFDILYFRKALQVAKTVCRVIQYKGDRKEAIGTGFLVGSNLLLTNNHVIGSIQEGTQYMAEFDYESDRMEHSVIFQLSPQLFFTTDKGLDYTVVGVQNIAMNNPHKTLKEFGMNTLTNLHKPVKKDQAVSIIQHPHGRTKMIAFRDNQIIDIHNTTFINYTTDTQPGSSGALVANDNWEIIGLHIGSIPRKDATGNTLLKNGGIHRNVLDDPYIDWAANQGVLISKILEHLSQTKVNESHRSLKRELLSLYSDRANEKSYKLPRRHLS